jgi:hypothetical protein
MSDDSNTVTCAEHGEAYTTFVCEHLVRNPVQRWYCAPPSEDNLWPDAWCPQCHVQYLKEGEWNEKNEEGLVAKILCHGCYETARASSVDRLTGKEARAWATIVKKSTEALRKKQRSLERNFELGRHKRWDWDQEKAQLIFSNDGIVAVQCDIVFVGSVSTISDTWLWAWANFGLTDAVRAHVNRVREFGEARDLPKLTVPKWAAEESDGWEMSAIAADVLKAKGVYRTPSQTGFTFLAILDAKWVQ